MRLVVCDWHLFLFCFRVLNLFLLKCVGRFDRFVLEAA